MFALSTGTPHTHRASGAGSGGGGIDTDVCIGISGFTGDGTYYGVYLGCIVYDRVTLQQPLLVEGLVTGCRAVRWIVGTRVHCVNALCELCALCALCIFLGN